ncbi:RNA-binding ribosome biosynthesis protein mak21 [Coemansia interrupta]|uniref:RNA-binding ribosome biosynthesis protein mak21 n=1 Tax=Coemansia interrupta TaxID=1126814 RepID=A0A9W8H5A7_9FUNG|nr:RNA-binding ribosome biosynthesis protein mak21 [Coemansia interrupta]
MPMLDHLGLLVHVDPQYLVKNFEAKDKKDKQPENTKTKKVDKAEKTEKSEKTAAAEDAPAKKAKSKNKYQDLADAAKAAKKAAKKATKADENESDDEKVDIPGFKIKSAKDSQTLAKAGRLEITPNAQWFDIQLDALEIDPSAPAPSEAEIVQKLEYATQLLDGENEQYAKRSGGKSSLSTSDRSFVSNILSSGTLSDRVSALTLMVQESPVHNVKYLGQLMAMVHKKNRREALMAVGSVKDLMSLNLLPGDRKLKYFAEQPIAAQGVGRAHWIVWAFEDKLKRHYFDLLQVMESMSYDPVVHTRQNMVNYFEELLEQKAEQEQNLLRLLVNKLGDKERQVAARASFLVLKLLTAHPNMKYVVVKTIQELLLGKSSTKERAQYYTVITINQVVLTSRDERTANLLVDVYFDVFKKLLKLTQGMDDAAAAEAAVDMDDAAKAGASAKTPAESKREAAEQQKKVQMGQKALRRAKQEAEAKRAAEERSMDNKLLAAILTGLHRALPYAQIEDSAMDRHVNLVFQMAHAGNFNTVVQALVLLQQVAGRRAALQDRFYRTLYDSLLDTRIEGTSKKTMYLNVLFRALRADGDSERRAAFVRRILQVSLYGQAEFASGALFLVSQVVRESGDAQLQALLGSATASEEKEEGQAYDALKRDPRYAHALGGRAWEVAMLAQHFHPSVRHSADQLMQGLPVAAIGNLHHHSLAHFLDRFVFRKPKSAAGAQKADGSDDSDDDVADRAFNAPSAAKPTGLRGQSLMQPFVYADGPAAGGFLASKRTKDALIDYDAPGAAPDEQFFHQFFSTKKLRMAGRRQSRKKKDDGEGGGEIDEDEVWRAMTANMPKAGDAGSGEDDEDEEDDEDVLAALESDVDDDDDDEGSSDKDEAGSDDDDDEGSDGFPNFDDEIGDSDLDSDADGFPGLSDSDPDDGAESEPESASATKKRKDAEPEDAAAAKRGKKKAKLPLFGSLEDYAHLIDSTEGLE